MKKRRVSLTMQIVVAVSAFLIVTNVFLGVSLSNQSRKAIKAMINSRMLDISNTAASMLDGDVLENFTYSDQGSEAYEAELDKLRVFQNNMELKYIYCIKKVGEKEFVFSIDPTVQDPGEFGSPIVYTEALYQASLGNSSVDTVPYEDDWGRFYSSYSPVFDSKGEVAVIVAVDFSAAWYESQIASFARTILINILIAVVIGAIIVVFIMRNVRNHFRALEEDLNDLTVDVDDITREMETSSGIEFEDEEHEDKPKLQTAEMIAEGEIQEIGRKIHIVRDNLREYVDHAHRQANSMITALASDYWSVYYIDLDSDEGICYRSHVKLEKGLAEGEHFIFSKVFKAYAEDYVAEGYREGFLAFIEPDNIRKSLATEPIIAYRYLSIKEGKESYEMLRMAGVRRMEDRADHVVHSIGVGFTDVDVEMRRSLDQSQALSDALTVAEEASKAKTVFLSNMSHEIRTPMNAIIGLDKIALSDPDISSKTRDYLEQIGSSANHLLKIINDILDMSRIESGRMIIKNEEFSFQKLIGQINAIIGSQCKDRDLLYKPEIADDIDRYYIGDDMKLKQVIINILGNSVKFTPAGGTISFKVERTARFDGKSMLRFTMSDTGIGMDEEFLPKIFDAFSQEDGSTTNRYGSTGLGMAITKNIVEMMNGEITVSSKKDKGTTFVVSVTLLDSDHKEDEHDIEIEINPHEMSVLIIDDDRIASEHARVELEKVGIEAEIADSGPDAIEMVRLRHARREPYNLILVDWKMPEMDGLETTRRIRDIIGDDTAIIILTSHHWDDILDEAINSGVDSFISKPLNSTYVLDQFNETVVQKNMKNSAQTRKISLEGRRILLAEDIAVNAKIMLKILSMKGIEADHALNGRIAVEMFKEKPVGYYDAILMDMRMPEMDGLQATVAIRALDREDAKKIPIIALTANAFDEDVQRSLQAGLNAHLSKPVEPEVVFDTLESLIQKGI